MPYAPRNDKCEHLGCKNPKSRLNGFCTDHGGLNATTRQSDGPYKTAAWLSVRARQLSVQPLCQACLTRGRVEQADTVDHVFPWRQIGKHAFMKNIWQSLCHDCHSHKTGLEKQGVFEHYTSEGIERLNVNDYALRVMAMR